MTFILSVIIAYLLGSISTSILVSKYLKLPDPRTEGSKNAGATNMLRVGGKKPAIYALVGDVLKGVIAVLIGMLFHISGPALAFVGLAAVVGHMFPVFFGFKGGKGVATTAGVMLVLSFWVTLFLLATWVIVLLLSRYVSLASIVTAVAMPIYLLISGNAQYAFPTFLIAVLVVWKHWSNIERLRNGTENKAKF